MLSISSILIDNLSLDLDPWFHIFLQILRPNLTNLSYIDELPTAWLNLTIDLKYSKFKKKEVGFKYEEHILNLNKIHDISQSKCVFSNTFNISASYPNPDPVNEYILKFC